MTHTPAESRPSFPASELFGPDSLIEAVRQSRLLLALAAAVEVDELPFEALKGLRLILEQALGTLKRADEYLTKEQHVCELWRDGTEERP